MNKYIKMAVLGFLVWLGPFIVSILIYGWHDTHRALFESVMAVILTVVVVKATFLYFINTDKDFFTDGILLGIIWFVISVVIDLILFLPESPMQMSLADYWMDIGLTYLIIIIVPIGFGWLLHKKQ